MKVELVTYGAKENGLSLFVVPETDAERVILQGLWRHGEMKICNGTADGTGQGYAVQWKVKADK